MAVAHPPCGNSTGKDVAVAYCLSLCPQLQEGRRDNGAMLPSLCCPPPSLLCPKTSRMDGAASCKVTLHLALILPLFT